MTVTQFDLPAARIAVGADPLNPRGPHPSVHTIYQQLHNYPVGTSGKERKEDAKGNKYNITPVRREFLSDLRAYLCLDFFDHPQIEDMIRKGLKGAAPKAEARYGIPFLGDNAFLIDRIDVIDKPVEALWYRALGPDADAGMLPRTTRLTTWIDRLDMSKTRSALFTPDGTAGEDSSDPAWTAWTTMEPPSRPTPPTKGRKKKD